MRLIHILLVLCTPADALTLGPARAVGSTMPRAPCHAVHRATTPVALFEGLFGSKKTPPTMPRGGNDDATLNSIMVKNPKEWTKEDQKQVDRISANWAFTRKPEQEGYMFFQGPTPKTGTQEDLPDFFSREARSDADVPVQLKVFGGIAATGALGLLAFVAIS